MSNNYLPHLQYLNAGIELKKNGKDFNLGNLFVSYQERTEMYDLGLIDNVNDITDIGRETFVSLKVQNLPNNFLDFARKNRNEKENPSLTARRPQYEILALSHQVFMLSNIQKQKEQATDKLEIGLLDKQIKNITQRIQKNYLNDRDKELLIQINMEKSIEQTVKYKDNQSANSPWKNSRISRTKYDQDQSDKLLDSYETAEKLQFNADKLISAYLSDASRSESIRFLNDAGLVGITKTSEQLGNYEKIKNHEVSLSNTGKILADSLTIQSLTKSHKKNMALA